VNKKPLIVVSIIAVVLLVLGSLSNVVGYQTVQTSSGINKRNVVGLEGNWLGFILDVFDNYSWLELGC